MFVLHLPPALFEHPALRAAQDDRPAKPNTFWIVTPFGPERQLEPKSTLGAYLTAQTTTTSYSDGSESSDTSIGLTLEYPRYTQAGARGGGYGAAVNFVGGVSFGPSLYYVTRPVGKGVAFRLGASFPLGSDVLPFYPQIALGFRF